VVIDGQPHALTEIAVRAMLLDADAARIVFRLVDADWVAREVDPLEPGRTLIRLTEHGRARYREHTTHPDPGGPTPPAGQMTR
jgi:DNA-binding MarR family transcriptional regulator